MNQKDPILMTFGLYSALGFQFAISVVAGLLLGNYFDGKWGTEPYLMLGGLIAGFTGGLYNLLKVLKWQKNK